MRSSLLAAASAAALIAGCGDDRVRPPVVMGGGGLEVRIHDAPARIEVVRDGEVVFDTLGGADGDAPPPDVFAATRASSATVEMRFGAFRFGPDDDTPWTGVSTLRGVSTDGHDAVFTLHDRAGDQIGDGRVVLDGGGPTGDVIVSLDLSAAGGNRASLGFACAPGEHFMGLGGQSWAVDHRGQTVPLWVQEDGIGKPDVADDDYQGIWALSGRRHSTHTPMPMMLSSRGWALAVDTSSRAVFHLCSDDPDVARLETWDDHLELRLFVGASPRDSLARMTAWVGRPDVPPEFTFAPWLDAIFGEDNVRRVADKLRLEDVPVSVIWTEDWRGGNDESGPAGGYVLEEDWRVDRRLYPDFEGLADHLHATGFKFLTYANTFLDVRADVRPEAVALGHTIHTGDGLTYDFTGVKFRDSSLLDLSSPAARAWAGEVMGEVLDLGSDGWMADFGEWLPPDARLASGESALTYHNRYPVEWLRFNHDLLAAATTRDGRERVFFARAAWLGAQPYAQVMWAGDQQTDFSLGDGLPSVIPMGIGLGLTGFPYFGHDIAGYMSQTTVPVSRELWFRWVTFGALSPVMRTHHGRSARSNWNWESDGASVSHLRRWARLHMQLVPYQRSMAQKAWATGAPLFRPFVLDYPDFEAGWTMTDQYMLGDRIAVAPIVTSGTISREVRLPRGTWYGLLDGRPLAASGTGPVAVTAELTEIPAYVPDCTLLVAYPPQVDTVVAAPAAAAGTVTAASIGDDRELWVYPCLGAPGAVSVMTEPTGLGYARSAPPFSTAGATWNGAPVTFTVAGGWATATVIGPGRLLVDGAEVVRAEGGRSDRRLTLRFAVP